MPNPNLTFNIVCRQGIFAVDFVEMMLLYYFEQNAIMDILKFKRMSFCLFIPMCRSTNHGVVLRHIKVRDNIIISKYCSVLTKYLHNLYYVSIKCKNKRKL